LFRPGEKGHSEQKGGMKGNWGKGGKKKPHKKTNRGQTPLNMVGLGKVQVERGVPDNFANTPKQRGRIQGGGKK